MTVETASYINQLDATLPTDTDVRSEGDNHIRLLKSTVKATFPNLTAIPVTATTSDLNAVVGASSTGATNLNVVTQTAGDSSTKAASTAFAAALAFSSALPSQTGNAGKFVTTNGTTASWAAAGLANVTVTLTTQTCAVNNAYLLTNVALTACTAPGLPADGDKFAVYPANGLLTNTLDFGAASVIGPGGTITGVLTLNPAAPMTFMYSTTLLKWVVL